jgi:hypothetical protein
MIKTAPIIHHFADSFPPGLINDAEDPVVSLGFIEVDESMVIDCFVDVGPSKLKIFCI